MGETIGYQHGVRAAMARLRKLDPGGTNAAGTGAWDKLERSLLILVADHDANITTPTDPEPPPPTVRLVAPKVANKENSSDARFCCVGQPGVTWQENHPLGPCYVDEVARYDRDGLHLGGRSDACTQDRTDGLVGAKQMDGRAPCDLPRVGDPMLNTGSWLV